MERINMKKHLWLKKRLCRVFLLTLCLASWHLCATAAQKQATQISRMKVEYETTPLAIETAHPRFSWQMQAPAETLNYFQKAYSIQVINEQGKTVWQTGKVDSGESLGITYQGEKLRPTSRYQWILTVWNQDNKPTTLQSWFETGLMCTTEKDEAWKNAQWIGPDETSNVLYSHYLPVFQYGITLQLDEQKKSKKAAFLLGVNDERLTDANKNIYQLQSERDRSYIKFELNTANLDNNEPASLAVYRVGYAPTDKEGEPLITFTLDPAWLNTSNRYAPHRIMVKVNNGITAVSFDNHALNEICLNPIGRGGDFIAFPVVADLGISVDKGEAATFSDATLYAYRSPRNPITRIESFNCHLSGDQEAKQLIVDPSRKSMPLLRTTFTAKGKVAKARLYITAHGVYEPYLNGKRLGTDYLNPGASQYNKTLMYQTYDVTEAIKQGANAMGAWLAEGWWSGGITFQGDNWNFFGDRQSLLARLHIIYSDGSEQDVVTSPETWKYFDEGPIVYGSLFQGEVYDATKEAPVKDWSTADYHASNDWKQCVVVPLDGHIGTEGWLATPAPDDYTAFHITAQMGNTIRPVTTLKAQSVNEVRKGVFVYDMGQNMVGVPKITFRGLKPADKITLRYAEVLYPEMEEYKSNAGMIMLENIRAAMAQDIYTAKGTTEESYSPRFTYHGYRFIEITGIDKPLPLENVQGIVLSSIDQIASHYETSNEKINRLWENIKWSTLGNFFSIPTDCPQRNERMGWAGDISVFSRTATYMSDASRFLRKFLGDMRDVQLENGKFQDIAPVGGGFGGLLWGSAGITVPWECYQQYGDTVLLREHYAAMKKYIAYIQTHTIDPKTNIIVQSKQWGDLCDWLGLEDNKNDKSLLWEAYYIYDLQLMEKIAQILGHQMDAERYKNEREKRIDHFHATYIDPQTGKTIASAFDEKREGQLVDTQTSYVLPLAFGFIKPAIKEKFIANFKNTVTRTNYTDQGTECPPYSLMTGFIGTAWISKALTEAGLNDIAYRLLRQESYPSWLYPVNQGATSVWERLNSYTKQNGFGGNNSMNSFNHYSFGAVGAWMYNYSVGIQRDEKAPGFKHFFIRPHADEQNGLSFAQGHYDSMYGRIESRWERKNGMIRYDITIPANTGATVEIPGLQPQELSSGSYTFQVKE